MAVFENERRRLSAIAYRMLASVGEAEDVLQDAFLRWSAVDRASVLSPAAWLTKVVVNLCINVLTSARVRHEAYVGIWLPEPVSTGWAAPGHGGNLAGPFETVAQRDSISLGMLLLFERLTPPERAVFILHEAFAFPIVQIADILDIPPANGRQLLHRAKSRVGAEPRRAIEQGADARHVVELFLNAAAGGDLDGLVDVLAADVVSWADGGGRVSAARHPILGSDRVSRYLIGLFRRPETEGATARVADVNGVPAVVLTAPSGLPIGVGIPEIAGGLVATLRLILNPDKLHYIT